MKKIINSIIIGITLPIVLVSCKTNLKINTSLETITESKIEKNTSTIKESLTTIESTTNSTTNTKNTNLKSLGTWWWNSNLDLNEYISFAKENKVTEIYYCNYRLDKSDEILKLAKENNMNVYLLLGEKEWLNDRKDLDTIIQNYISYQNIHNNKFSGIHFDIEPHQFNNFKTNRSDYLYKLIDIIKTNKDKYNSISFDYDIPFWLDDNITYNEESKECYKHIIDYADRVFLMSYRDTAEEMYNVSKDEILYAKNNSKIVYLGAETYSTEGDNVSYFEEGKNKMYFELNKLRSVLPDNFGIAIHNIKSWKDLKE